MIVKVDIPPKDLWLLTDRAEREGITVGALLLAVATDQETTAVVHESTHDRVRALWAQGLCDADIAANLHMTPGHTKKVRLDMKLPANRRYKATAETIRAAAYKEYQAEKRSA